MVECGFWADSQQWQCWQRVGTNCAVSRGLLDDSMPSLIPSCRAQLQVMERTLTGLRGAGVPTHPGAALGKWREVHVTSRSAGLAGTFLSSRWTRLLLSFSYWPAAAYFSGIRYARTTPQKDLLGHFTGFPFGSLSILFPPKSVLPTGLGGSGAALFTGRGILTKSLVV